MTDKSDLVKVTIYIPPETLLNGNPEELRQELGENVYRTALRKLDPPTPEELGVKPSDLD